jgi:hypothetical protein
MIPTDGYLKAILGTMARQAFPPNVVADLVAPKGSGEKQIAAYNLCDGEHTQAEIASAVRIDKANLSRSISRWIDHGILFRLNIGGDMRPVHIYPLSIDFPRKLKAKKNGS